MKTLAEIAKEVNNEQKNKHGTDIKPVQTSLDLPRDETIRRTAKSEVETELMEEEP